VNTIGANYEGILRNPLVCRKHTRTSDIISSYSAWGIENGIRCIADEIISVMLSHGILIDIRHPILIAETMGYLGRISAMNRFGAIHNTESLVVHSSFEETGPTLLRGAAFGQFDPMVGPSERLVIGMFYCPLFFLVLIESFLFLTGTEVRAGSGVVKVCPTMDAGMFEEQAKQYLEEWQYRQRAVALPDEIITIESLQPFVASASGDIIVTPIYDLLLLADHSAAALPVASLSTNWPPSLQIKDYGFETAEQLLSAVELWSRLIYRSTASKSSNSKSDYKTAGQLVGKWHKCPTCRINDCIGRQCRRCHQILSLNKQLRAFQPIARYGRNQSRQISKDQKLSVESMLALNNRGGEIVVKDDDNKKEKQEEKEIYRPSTPDYEPAMLEKETEMTSDIQVTTIDEFGHDMTEEELPLAKRSKS
jgi:hypothetical protein